MKKRQAKIDRKTKETNIVGKLTVDGNCKAAVKTGIGFLDHMLNLFTFHGFFDIDLKVIKGDLDVDIHHTNEDVGICLGKAFKDALGDCKGIRRYGFSKVPMDLASAEVNVDIGGRYAFVWGREPLSLSNLNLEDKLKSEGYSLSDGKDFLDSFAKNANINLHVKVHAGEDAHHILEAVFKAFGIAMDQATQIDPRQKDIPSTKGII